MEKNLKLNFNINGESLNGHKYDKEMLLKEFNSKIENNDLLVYLDTDFTKDVNKVVGTVLSFKEKDGDIEVAINLTNPDLYEKIEENSKITTCGIGTLKEDDKVIEDFKLTHLALTNDEGD